MLIAELYEVLDDLEPQASALAEQFAEDGDLKALENNLDALGHRAYAISRGIMQIREALKFSE